MLPRWWWRLLLLLLLKVSVMFARLHALSPLFGGSALWHASMSSSGMAARPLLLPLGILQV